MNSTRGSRSTTNPPVTLLKPYDPELLQWEMQQIQLAITRRAYELFETRTREHGHDWEDWFQAESELLRPVSIAMSETADRFSLRANVLGFSEAELKVSVEPKRIAILGRRNITLAGAEGTPPADMYPDLILRSIDLASDVDPAGAVIEFQSGVLKFELPKAVKQESKAAAASKV